MRLNKMFLVLSILSIGILTSCSSVNSMNDFYSKYEEKATVIPVPNFALKWAQKATGGSNIYQYLKSAKVFVMKNVSDSTQKRVMKDLQSSAKGDKFDEMVKWNKNKNNLEIYLLENNHKIERLVFGVNGLNNVLVIDSKLNIDTELVEKLLDNINLEDIQFLKDILNY